MNDSDRPTTTRTLAGIPLRLFVAVTAIASVVAISAGVLIAMALDDGGPDVIGSGDPDGGGFELVPAAEDEALLGAPLAVSYETFDGDPANTGSYVGQPLVVNFFAAWCAPCVAEMPDFEDVYQQVGDQVAFLGISTDHRPEDGLDLVERTGITYDLGRDPDGDTFGAFGALAMPTTAFVDAAGTVVEVHSGALTAGQLRDRIDRHFGVAAQ